MASRSYYTLIASLPHLPAGFEVERNPITWLRLQERLKMLDPRDAAVIDQVSEFLTWDRQPVDRTDEQMVAHYHRLTSSINNALLIELIEQRMDIRTIVSAIRCRRRDTGPPEGIGRLADHVRRHWHDPEFRLQSRYRWITALDTAIADGRAGDAEKLIFSVTWKIWSQLAQRYTFSFEAVILYIARWEIIDRWTNRDAGAGSARFEKLLMETLGEHANIPQS